MTTKTETPEELSVEFLHCRSFGHAWEEYVPVAKRRPEFGFRFSLLCTTCTAERHDLLDNLGRLIPGGRSYVYPDGYQLGCSVTRSEMRVLYNQRRKKKNLARRGALLKLVDRGV